MVQAVPRAEVFRSAEFQAEEGNREAGPAVEEVAMDPAMEEVVMDPVAVDPAAAVARVGVAPVVVAPGVVAPVVGLGPAALAVVDPAEAASAPVAVAPVAAALHEVADARNWCFWERRIRWFLSWLSCNPRLAVAGAKVEVAKGDLEAAREVAEVLAVDADKVDPAWVVDADKVDPGWVVDAGKEAGAAQGLAGLEVVAPVAAETDKDKADGPAWEVPWDQEEPGGKEVEGNRISNLGPRLPSRA